jgi:hypothetical protein
MVTELGTIKYRRAIKKDSRKVTMSLNFRFSLDTGVFFSLNFGQLSLLNTGTKPQLAQVRSNTNEYTRRIDGSEI